MYILLSDRKKVKDKEQSLCRQFSFILSTFEILASVKIMPGQASEAIFKNLQKVYNFACALAKYFKKKSTATNPAFQSVKYAVTVFFFFLFSTFFKTLTIKNRLLIFRYLDSFK